MKKLCVRCKRLKDKISMSMYHGKLQSLCSQCDKEIENCQKKVHKDYADYVRRKGK